MKSKINLSFFVNDWEDFQKFKRKMILEKKDLSYTNGDAIRDGFELLNKKHNIVKGRPKVKLPSGRRIGKAKPLKFTSVDLNAEQLDFINDYLYHKVFIEENIKFTRSHMLAEMLECIRLEHKNIYHE